MRIHGIRSCSFLWTRASWVCLQEAGSWCRRRLFFCIEGEIRTRRPKRRGMGMSSKAETGRFKSKAILPEVWDNFLDSDN